MPKITVAEVIIDQLKLLGVQRIYGVIGDAIFGFMDALAKQDAISFIAVKHESVAAMIASAEAKLTGQLSVCVAQMGPGLANLINGLGDAYMDKAPVLAITGQAPLNKIGTNYKQFINQQQMVQAISSYSQLVVHPEAIVESLTKAVHTSVVNQTVSHLTIPMDVFTLEATMMPCKIPTKSIASIDPSAYEQALLIMKSSKQPMMLLGSKVQAETSAIQALAETWGCGIVMSYGAMGKVPDSHPLMLNGLGEGGNPLLADLFKQADVVLTLETSWWPDGLVPNNVRVVQVTNNAINLGVTIPMDVGLIADATSIIPKLTADLSQYQPNPNWIHQIKQCKQAWSTLNDKERNQATSPLHPSNIIKIMEQHIADDAVITLDEGDSTLWFMRNFRTKNQQVLLSERWRTMGFGLPAAIAAKLCLPDKQIICITGDGGLEMVLADLVTALKYSLPIIVIVFNNGTLQMEQDKMLMKRMQPEGTKLSNPNFAKVAEACGWNSYRIETPEQLEAAFVQSAGNKPTLLDVLTAKIPHPDFN